MSAESLDVSVGARLWYQASAWTVVELDADAVVLRAADRLTRVHVPSLIGVARPLDEGVQDADPPIDEFAQAHGLDLGPSATSVPIADHSDAEARLACPAEGIGHGGVEPVTRPEHRRPLGQQLLDRLLPAKFSGDTRQEGRTIPDPPLRLVVGDQPVSKLWLTCGARCFPRPLL